MEFLRSSSQTSFGGKTSGRVAKCRLFSQTRIFVLLVALKLKLLRIYEELYIKKNDEKMASPFVRRAINSTDGCLFKGWIRLFFKNSRRA